MREVHVWASFACVDRIYSVDMVRRASGWPNKNGRVHVSRCQCIGRGGDSSVAIVAQLCRMIASARDRATK